MESNTSINLNVNTILEAELHIDKSQAQTELDKLFETIQQKLKETTTREIGEYATAAGEAISASWDSAKQTVSDVGGEAITDTLSAIFSGEMDKVQDIWDKAWTDMGDGLEKSWEGLLSTLGEKAMEGLGDILQESILDPISDYLTTAVWEPLKDWGLGLLGDGLDWLGLGDIGKVLGLGGGGVTGSVSGASGIGSLASTASTASTLYSVGTTAYEVLGAAAASGSVIEGLGAAIGAAMTGKDVATAVTLATGYINSAAAEAALATEVASALSSTGAAAGAGTAAGQAAAVTGIGSDVVAGSGAAAAGAGVGTGAAAASMGATLAPVGVAMAALLAVAEGAAAIFGETGPVTGLIESFGKTNELTAEEARHMVANNMQTLADTASAAASGDWSSAINAVPTLQSDQPGSQFNRVAQGLAGMGGALAMNSTKRYGAGNSIASVGGISTEEIEATVAAMGPYAQALYDVQSIYWEVSDAMQAYNDAAERGWFAQGEEAEKLQELAYELGVTEQQYQLMIEAGYSYEQMSAVVNETAGDLRIAMIDMAGAMERAAAEMGLTGEQADIFGSQAAVLWEQVQAGTLGVSEFDRSLEDLGMSLGLDETASAQLAARLENMLAASNQAGEGAQGLSNELAALAAQSGTAAASAAGVTGSIIDFGNVVGGAASSTWGLIDVVGGATSAASNLGGVLGQAGSQAAAFGESASEVMSSTFVSWKEGFGQMADSASELSGEVLGVGRALANVFGTSSFAGVSNLGSVGFVYHDGGLAGSAGWPRFHSGLLPDELPAILQRGEAIIRRRAVNAQTLPVLRSINDTGRAPESSGGLSVHVEVHGNVLGDGDGMEELARIIDRKLRRIDGVRYSM